MRARCQLLRTRPASDAWLSTAQLVRPATLSHIGHRRARARKRERGTEPRRDPSYAKTAPGLFRSQLGRGTIEIVYGVGPEALQ
jgi:hypothetical protein